MCTGKEITVNNSITAMLQPWAKCVGKWQKHELITVIPIE